VRVWGTDGSESDWSEAVAVEASLLTLDDWHASFITPNWEEEASRSNPSPYLRREFDLRGDITSARLYITALGVYEAQINGSAVGDHVLAPGWTVYDQHLRYQTFDVTDILRPGRNAIGAILGDGWFRGRLGFEGGKRNIYGEHLALLAQLEIQYTDGSSERIVTDERWPRRHRSHPDEQHLRRRNLRCAPATSRMVIPWIRRFRLDQCPPN